MSWEIHPGNAARREQAELNWHKRIRIGKKTRSIVDWMGRISDPALSDYTHQAKNQPYSDVTVAYQPSTIGMKRRTLGIAKYSGSSAVSSFEIASVRCKNNTKLLMSFGNGRPMSAEMKEFLLQKDMAALEKKDGNRRMA